MKIDRLIGILSILLQKEKVTAPYLAEKFEVSRKTINRDVEALCRAGIPLVTSQGKNGGISIMEGYRVDRTLLTSADMQDILAGLGSLDSVSGTKRYQHLMEKLAPGEEKLASGEEKLAFGKEKPVLGEEGMGAGKERWMDSRQHVMIDLSSWYKPTLAPKIQLIQEAIEQKHVIVFRYCSPKGESERRLEPALLVFQWASWYVWGYCRERQEFRLFKLNRIVSLEKTEEIFAQRPVPAPDLSADRMFPARMQVKALFEPQMKWRLIEEFGTDSFTEQEDGRLLFSFGFGDRDNLLSWILSFGDQAELLEPAKMKEELVAMVEGICKKYRPIEDRRNE